MGGSVGERVKSSRSARRASLGRYSGWGLIGPPNSSLEPRRSAPAYYAGPPARPAPDSAGWPQPDVDLAASPAYIMEESCLLPSGGSARTRWAFSLLRQH